MARCELTGKSPKSAHLVSHSNIKVKTRNFPNVQSKHLFSRALGSSVSLKVATTTIRNIEHAGGFDTFILKQDDKALSKRARAVKKQIRKKLSRPPKSHQGSHHETKN